MNTCSPPDAAHRSIGVTLSICLTDKRNTLINIHGKVSLLIFVKTEIQIVCFKMTQSQWQHFEEHFTLKCISYCLPSRYYARCVLDRYRQRQILSINISVHNSVTRQVIHLTLHSRGLPLYSMLYFLIRFHIIHNKIRNSWRCMKPMSSLWRVYTWKQLDSSYMNHHASGFKMYNPLKW